MPFPIDWASSHEIQIDHTKVSATLSNIAILLTQSNLLDDLFDNTQIAGQDIRFSSDEAGENQLAFEIVDFANGATYTAEIWVNIPSLSNTVDTSIYIWYNNSVANALPVTDIYGRNAVWSLKYKTVQHFTGGIGDSTSNGLNGTTGGVTSNSNGKIGNSAVFNRSESDYVSLGNITYTKANIFSISLWFKSTNDIDIKAIYSTGYYNTYKLHDGEQLVIHVQNLNLSFQHYDRDGYFWINSIIEIDPTVWNKLTVVRNSATSQSYYLNGTFVETKTVADITDSVRYDVIGARNTTDIIPYSSNFNGELDEFRLTDSAPTSQQIYTEFLNENSPETFSTPIIPIPTHKNLAQCIHY